MPRFLGQAEREEVRRWIMDTSLTEVLICVMLGCYERASTLGGCAAQAWQDGAKLVMETSIKVQEKGL